MATKEPAVRAGAIHDALAFLDVFEPGARARVLDLVPPPSREIILNTSRSAWVLIEHDRHNIDAIVQLFGVKRAIQFWRGATTQLAERPLLKNFVSGMISLLGDDPGRIIGIVPRGWSLVYRDCCDVTYDRTSTGRATLRFENIAPEVRAASSYLHSWHGTCLGMADLARMRGAVEFATTTKLTSAEARFSWSAKLSQARPH